jgi:putative transposase
LTEGKGIPTAVVVAGANRHDMKLLADTLEALVVERPEPSDEAPQHLCADKAYDYPAYHQRAERQGYIPHIRSRGEEKDELARTPGYRPRRWVVEVCHSWLNRFRKILLRFEKNLDTHRRGWCNWLVPILFSKEPEFLDRLSRLATLRIFWPKLAQHPCALIYGRGPEVQIPFGEREGGGYLCVLPLLRPWKCERRR